MAVLLIFSKPEALNPWKPWSLSQRLRLHSVLPGSMATLAHRFVLLVTIFYFHGVLVQSFCEGQEAEAGRERVRPFQCLCSFPKQMHFIWLLDHVFADILLHEVEGVAAKRLFTLVWISVVKHCPFFPRITGKFTYPLASSLVLPDNKINSSYWVVTLLLFSLSLGA